MITFSLSPCKKSIFPLIEASVSTRVVSWKDAAERNESVSSELLVIPKSIGLPVAGTYEEIFNSDDEKYGGSGVINRKPLVSDRIDWNGRQSSIELKVPPLGVTILRRTEQNDTY